MTWHNLTKRFIVVGTVLPALLLAIGVMVVLVGRAIQSDSFFIRYDAVPGSIAARSMQVALADNFSASSLAISDSQTGERAVHLREVEATDRRYAEAAHAYRATMLINPALDEAQLLHFEAARDGYVKVRDDYLQRLASAGAGDASAILHGPLLQSYQAARLAGEKVVDYNDGNIVAYSARISDQIGWLKATLVSVVVLSLACGVYLSVSLWLRRREVLMVNQQMERFAIAANVARVVIWVRHFDTGAIEWTDLIDEICGFGRGGAPRTIEGWLALVDRQDLPSVQAAFGAYRKDRVPFELEYRVRKKTGEVIWVRDMGSSQARTPATVHTMFGALRDVTQRHRAESAAAVLESQLRQSQKLEAVGTLAGGIAHDFNNILTGINGTAEMLLGDLRERNADPGDLASLETILQCGSRARNLVHQILAFSRQQQTQKEPTDIPALVREVAKLIRSTTPAGIEVKVEIEQDVPIVLADGTQIHQVLLNLCTNAIQAMKGERGALTLKLDALQADADFLKVHAGLQPGRQVRISVSDTGGGMDAATMKRIFEPFFTTKKPGEGTGLGLSVAHGIVREHGGAIFPYSRVGEGTVFHVYLPGMADSARVEAAAPQGALGHGENVLLVDDEGVIGTVAAKMLSRRNFVVRHLGNPVEALREFQKNPSAFDVVVTDFQMPGMTGLELATAVKRSRPGVPIVLMSGFVGNASATALKEIGVTELLYKPLTSANLATAVRRAIDENVSLEAAPRA